MTAALRHHHLLYQSRHCARLRRQPHRHHSSSSSTAATYSVIIGIPIGILLLIIIPFGPAPKEALE